MAMPCSICRYGHGAESLIILCPNFYYYLLQSTITMDKFEYAIGGGLVVCMITDALEKVFWPYNGPLHDNTLRDMQ